MKSEFANQSKVSKEDAASLDSSLGREDHFGMAEASRLVSDEIKQPIGAHPKSEETGKHDAGSGANETIDGLDSSNEAIRKGAEDIPVGPKKRKDLPVFDRGRE